MTDRPCILIAEDDASLADTMREVFADDFSVETAADGVEAVSVARRVHPDVVVLDASMPRMDGLSACRALREDPATADLPIIMVTGEDPAVAASRAFDAGATDFLPKPFSISQLRARATICAMRGARAS
jgi:two-component system, OmpR family, response regulator MprA